MRSKIWAMSVGVPQPRARLGELLAHLVDDLSSRRRAARRGSSPWRCAAGPGPGTSTRHRAGSRCRDDRRHGPPGARRTAARPGRRASAGRTDCSIAVESSRAKASSSTSGRAMAPTVGSAITGRAGRPQTARAGRPRCDRLRCPPGVGWAAVGEQVGQGVQAGEVAGTPLLGVEGDLRQRGQHGVHRRDEGVADGELDLRHRSGIGHAPRQVADEVEGLELRLVEALVGRLLRPARRPTSACEPGPARPRR